MQNYLFCCPFQWRGESGADDQGPYSLYKGHTNTLGSMSMISNKNLNKNMPKMRLFFFWKIVKITKVLRDLTTDHVKQGNCARASAEKYPGKSSEKRPKNSKKRPTISVPTKIRRRGRHGPLCPPLPKPMKLWISTFKGNSVT